MSASSVSSGVPVSFAELRSAVAGVVAGGQVGEPVNVRAHLDVANDSTGLADAVLTAATLADAALNLSETRWTVRRDAGGLLLNVLGVDDRGQTALLTASRSAVDRVSLTIFGNHGVARVERAELTEELPAEDGCKNAWRSSLRAALRD